MFDKAKSELYAVIKKVIRTVTAADVVDLSTDYPLRQRGTRKGKIGTIMQRAFGSQHIYEAGDYPIAPIADIAVTGTAGNGGTPNLVRLELTDHGLVAGAEIIVSGVGGTTEANGTWIVAVPDSTHVDLVGSVFVNAWTSGGIAVLSTIRPIAPLSPLYDPETNSLHNIYVGVDVSGQSMLKINVDENDGDNASPNWADLTRILSGTIGAVAATYIDITTNTIAEQNLVAIRPSGSVPSFTDYFNGWVLWNKTVAEYSKAVTGAIDNGSGLIRLTVTGHGLLSNSVVSVSGVGGTTEANNTWTNITVIDVNTIDLVGSTFTNAYTSPGTITRLSPVSLLINGVAGSTADNGATIRTTFVGNIEIATFKLWYAGDVVLIMKSRSMLGQWSAGTYNYGYAAGSHFRVNFIDNEAQRKRTLYLSKQNGSGKYEGQTPLRIQRCNERNRFYTAATTALETLPAGWYLEAPIHSPFYDKIGTIETPLTGTGSYISVTDTTPEMHWMVIRGTAGNTGGAIYRDLEPLKYMRVYVVPVYDGYQRGNPIVEYFVSSGGANAPILALEFYLSPAKMNQHLTGLEVYAQHITDVQYKTTSTGKGQRDFFDADMRLVKTIAFDVYDSTVTFAANAGSLADEVISVSYTISALQGDWEYHEKIDLLPPIVREHFNVDSSQFVVPSRISFTDSGTSSIVTALNHPVVKVREIVKPRFATRAGNVDGAVNVVDVGDSTLAVNHVGGNGAVWDDAFVNVLSSNSGSRMRIPIQSDGELKGIKFIGVQYSGQYPVQHVIAFKTNEIEVIGLAGGNRRIVADVTSMTSIVEHEQGVVWGGDAGFFELRSVGGGVELINSDTVNEYDGSLLADDNTTPITTAAYRAAAVGEYIPQMRCVMFVIQQNKPEGGVEYVCKFYHIDKREFLPERIFGDTSSGRNIAFIGKRRDKLVNLLIQGVGVIKYPVIGKFKDEMLFDGTGGVGYPAEQIINVGNLYSYDPLNQLKWFATDFKGTVVSGAPTFRTSFFANDETTAFDTHDQLVSGSEREIQIKNRGGVRRLRVKQELTAANALLTGELEIRTLIIGYDPLKREGLK